MAGVPTGQGALRRAWARALGRLVHRGSDTSNDPIRSPGSRRRLVRHALGRAPACGRPAAMGALHHGVRCGRIRRSRGAASRTSTSVGPAKTPTGSWRAACTAGSPSGSHAPRSATRLFSGLWRISRYVLPLCAIEYSHRRQAWFIGLPRRRGRPETTTFYKGTQWIGFNRRSAEAVLGTDPAVTEWFKRSHIPDETYLQTVLHNAPGLNVSN